MFVTENPNQSDLYQLRIDDDSNTIRFDSIGMNAIKFYVVSDLSVRCVGYVRVSNVQKQIIMTIKYTRIDLIFYAFDMDEMICFQDSTDRLDGEIVVWFANQSWNLIR